LSHRDPQTGHIDVGIPDASMGSAISVLLRFIEDQFP
jgi:hypothetical protein